MRKLLPIYEQLSRYDLDIIDITKNIKTISEQYIVRIDSEDVSIVDTIRENIGTINIIDYMIHSYHKGGTIKKELWVYFEFIGDGIDGNN